MEKLQNSLCPLALQETNTERKHSGSSSYDTGPSHRHILLLPKPQRPGPQASSSSDPLTPHKHLLPTERQHSLVTVHKDGDAGFSQGYEGTVKEKEK